MVTKYHFCLRSLHITSSKEHADEDLKALKMTFHSSTEDNDIDFKVKTFLNDAKNWSNFRYKIKLRLNKVNKTKQAVIIEDDGPTMTSVPLQSTNCSNLHVHYGNTGCGVFKRGYKIRKIFA